MTQSNNENILIIIPTYNEAENIKKAVHDVFSAAQNIEILIVDDNSPDGTGAIVQELMQNDKKIHLLKRASKNGLRQAYVAGFHWGIENGFSWLCEMDADGSHRALDLKNLLNARTDADVIVGSRYTPGGGIKGWSWIRHQISYFGNVYARIILGVRFGDLTGGFNLWNKEVLEKIDFASLMCEGYGFQIELKYRAILMGFKLKEVPILFLERAYGTSKMKPNIALEAAWGVPKLKKWKPSEKIK